MIGWKAFMGRSAIISSIFRWTFVILAGVCQLFFASPGFARLQPDTEHVTTRDLAVVNDAFLQGYTHNEVTDVIRGQGYPTLAIGCVGTYGYRPHDEGSTNEALSVWTRDLMWGFLGWSQAGDDRVLARMQSSLGVLINCMHRNQAVGKNRSWPLNDRRFYIPQAFTNGGKIAQSFFPFCSESQADFLLLAHEYWMMSGNDTYIRNIWPDILYVTETLEKMDSNGNALPDQLWGTYDYQGIGRNTEEPLMSAKTALAYRDVAEMARDIDQPKIAQPLEKLADRIQVQMNKPVEKGGLWKSLPDGGGYFVNQRNHINDNGSAGMIDDRLIPYENLVPIFCGMTSKARTEAIFTVLDRRFDQFYSLKWGPEYVVPAHASPKKVIACSTAPWLGFLDVYLRCKLDHPANRSEIFKLLIDHAYDVPSAPFAEGAGNSGVLTGGAGRAWDNGNFFHCLINGIYNVEKDKDGLTIGAPVKMADFLLTELNHVRWRDATYHLQWRGEGTKIETVTLDGRPVKKSGAEYYRLTEKTEAHEVVVEMTK
jgi:hypothetical protein